MLNAIKLENLMALADEDPQQVLKDAALLSNQIVEKLIKQFGNGKVVNLEIFIKPLMMKAHIALFADETGMGRECKIVFELLQQMVVELYGTESELEIQLFDIKNSLHQNTIALLGQTID